MVYSDTISILDSVTDSDGLCKIIQYVLTGVYLERSSGATIDKDGEKRAYNCTLFVPQSVRAEEQYVEPRVWENLPFEEKLNNYTFRPQQLIVGTGSLLSYNSLDDVKNNEPICYTVVGVDYLSKVLPHFEVLGK